ncbi:unnamed protein product, partial [Mesorhabditis spiculigera]
MKAVILRDGDETHLIHTWGTRLMYRGVDDSYRTIECMRVDGQRRREHEIIDLLYNSSERALMCLLCDGTVCTFGCTVKHGGLSLTPLRCSKNPYMDRAIGWLHLRSFEAVVVGFAYGTNPLNRQAWSIVLYDQVTETLICTSVKDYSLLHEPEKRFHGISYGTFRKMPVLHCTIGHHDEVAGFYMEPIIPKITQLQRCRNWKSEIFMKVNGHSLSRNYYDGAFANTRESTANGHRFLRTTLFLLSSEGVEVLELVVKGTKLEQPKDCAEIVLPEVIIPDRALFPNLFVAENLVAWQICSINSKSNEKGAVVLFCVGRCLKDDITIFYIFFLIYNTDSFMTDERKVSRGCLTGNWIENAMQLVDKESHYVVALNLGSAMPQSSLICASGIYHVLVRRQKEYCFVALRDNKSKKKNYHAVHGLIELHATYGMHQLTHIFDDHGLVYSRHGLHILRLCSCQSDSMSDYSVITRLGEGALLVEPAAEPPIFIQEEVPMEILIEQFRSS